jgi:prepilin-type processing-associated H-X9-DG protein
MSQSVNGYPLMIDPQSGYYAAALQPCFSRLSSITNQTPRGVFVFIDENEASLQDAQFGYPMINSSSYGCWWDMPSNRHDQGANLSFVDGHIEHWHWMVPMLDTYPPGYAVPVAPGQLPDYTRLGNSMRLVPIDLGASPPGEPRM